jgi:putative FmdB family regulatory protein
MPIYEYSCKKCGQTIEIIQKFSDRPLKKHTGCGGTLTKLISQSAFQLKGSGWYATDYVKKPQPSGESGGKDSSDSKAGDSKTGKDSKDSKKESKTTESSKDSSSTKAASPAPSTSGGSSKSSDS